jgi:hypothetical protein
VHRYNRTHQHARLRTHTDSTSQHDGQHGSCLAFLGLRRVQKFRRSQSAQSIVSEADSWSCRSLGRTGGLEGSVRRLSRFSEGPLLEPLLCIKCCFRCCLAFRRSAREPLDESMDWASWGCLIPFAIEYVGRETPSPWPSDLALLDRGLILFVLFRSVPFQRYLDR